MKATRSVVGGFNGGGGSFNIGGYNGGSSYNVGGYTMVVHSTLHKQLCWEFGVSHNYLCITSKGPLMYVLTCLETLCSQLILVIS